MNERVADGESCLILYDSTLHAVPNCRWLLPAWWASQQAVSADLGGRGQAMLVQTACGPAVVRRFLRGGWMGPLLGDRYWRRTPERSRGFREFRLLYRLRQLALPVPRPLAASFEPAGLFYRAGLLTEFIPDAQSLAAVAEHLSGSDWRALAQMLKRFFAVGLLHPDLNAHNLLLDRSGQWHLLDFDRARLRGRPADAKPMLARLERSLCKHAGTAWRKGFEAELRGTLTGAVRKSL